MNSYGAATATGTPAYKRWAAPGSREEAWASQAVASVRLTEGRYREASTLRTQAVTLARELGDGATLVRAATNAFVFASAAEEAERSRLLQGLVDGSQEGVRTLSNALLYAGSAWLMHGERDRAEALWREVAALADRTRAAGPMVFAGLPPIILATLDGRLEEALAATERAITLGDELGAGVRARLVANGQSGRALIWLGRAAEALTRVGEAAQLAGAAESLELQGQRALILAHLGERAQASALLRQLVDRLGDELEAANYGFILNLLEAAGLVGDIETAQTLVSALRPVAHLSFGFNWAGAPSRLLGRAAALLGKPDEARSYYLQALEACAKIRFRPEIALTRLQLAELLLEHYPHERADALAHLDFAITEFREMKMQPSLDPGGRGLG